MAYQHTIGGERWQFSDLREVMAKATPLRSGDALAGVATTSAVERMAARLCLADIPLSRFLSEALIPYESDEVTRLILDTHNAAAFAPLAHLTVGTSATGCWPTAPTAPCSPPWHPASRPRWRRP